MLDFIAFYLFSALIIACFAVVVLSSNVLYTMSALASGMILIAGIFFVLGAEFLGVVQISVYTGAVMALYAFGMMFFDSAKSVKERKSPNKFIACISVGIAVLLVVIVTLPRVLVISTPDELIETSGNVEKIGVALFTKYLLPFEIAALMLLIAMIAGIVLAMKKDKDSASRESTSFASKGEAI